MNTQLQTLFPALVILIFSFVGNAQTSLKESQDYAITHVNVIPMDTEVVLENHTVTIKQGRITSIQPSNVAKLPANIQIINGKDKYLIPGLAEMHGHIPGKDQADFAEEVLLLYIVNGVTTVRNMLGNVYNLQLRDRVKNHELPGPTIFAAGPFFSKEQVPNPDAAEKAVREQKAAGFDLLKMGSIDRESYARMAQTAREVAIPFAGHVPQEVGLVGALEAGQKSIDHYDRYVEFLVPENVSISNRSTGFFGSGIIDLIDRQRMGDAVTRTVEAEIWNVPTLSLIENLASPEPAEEMIQRPEMDYMPREVLDNWVKFKNDYTKRDDFKPEATRVLVDLRRELTRELHAAGANIALGSDAPQFFNVPGFSIHREMEMMVNAGLTPFEVLVTGTRNPAIYFDMPEEFGTIATGKRADLILLDANPLEDISNTQKISGVMVRGKWYSKEEIERELQKIRKR